MIIFVSSKSAYMSDTLTKEKRSELMSHIRSTNTKPEVELRHALWRQGFRYRKNVKRLPGSPDIVLPKYRTVVFMHGCFWHGHKDCRIYHLPQTNTDFWLAKVTRNQERDQEVWRQLEAKGWAVVIVWECELFKGKIDNTIKRVSEEILANGEVYRRHRDSRLVEREKWRIKQKAARDRRQALMEEISLL